MINSEINWKQNLRVAWLGNFLPGQAFRLLCLLWLYMLNNLEHLKIR